MFKPMGSDDYDPRFYSESRVIESISVATLVRLRHPRLETELIG